MEPAYRLTYYDRIFPSRGPAFWELVSALADELDDYAQSIDRWEPLGTEADLARLRHSHRPLVLNLELTALASLEADLRVAAAVPGSRDRRPAAEALAALARQTSEALRAEVCGHAVT